MMLRFIISLTVALMFFFFTEGRYTDYENVSVESGRICYAASEVEFTQLTAGCESLPQHLDGLRRFHRTHSWRMLGGGSSSFRVNGLPGVTLCSSRLMDMLHLSGTNCTGKVDFYIFWRNLRI